MRGVEVTAAARFMTGFSDAMEFETWRLQTPGERPHS